MDLRGPAEVVEHDPGLDARRPRGRVDLEDARQVAARVEDDRGVAGLAGQARARAAREDRHVVLGAHAQRGHDVVVVAREHDADGHVAVVRRIGGVHRAGAGVEADLAAQGGPERRLERTRGQRAARTSARWRGSVHGHGRRDRPSQRSVRLW
jgi:hypothetical protein